MELISNNHSKHMLLVHIVLVCKYRKPLLQLYGDYMKQEIISIGKRYDWNIVEIEYDKDHIHILIQFPPKDSVLKVVKIIKQITTINIWKEYMEYLSKEFWNEHTFWSDGYFAGTVGETNIDIVTNYIRNQGL